MREKYKMLNEDQIRGFKELFVTKSQFNFLELHSYFKESLDEIIRTICEFKVYSRSNITIKDKTVHINVKSESERDILLKELEEYFQLLQKSNHLNSLVLLFLFFNFFLLISSFLPRFPFSSSSLSISSIDPGYSLLITFNGILILLFFENKDLLAYIILLIVLTFDLFLSFIVYSIVYHGYFVYLMLRDVYELFVMFLVLVTIIKSPKFKIYF